MLGPLDFNEYDIDTIVNNLHSLNQSKVTEPMSTKSLPPKRAHEFHREMKQ